MSTPEQQIKGNIKRANKKRQREEIIDLSNERVENPVIKGMLAVRDKMRKDLNFLQIEDLIDRYKHDTEYYNKKNKSSNHSTNLNIQSDITESIVNQIPALITSQSSSENDTPILVSRHRYTNFKKREINKETQDIVAELRTKLAKHGLKIEANDNNLVTHLTVKGNEVEHLKCLTNGFDIVLDIVEENYPEIYKYTTKQNVFEQIFFNKFFLKNMQLFLSYSDELKNSRLDIFKLLPYLKEDTFTSFILHGIANPNFHDALSKADENYDFSTNFFCLHHKILNLYGSFLMKDRKIIKEYIKDDSVLQEFVDFPESLRIINMSVKACDKLIKEKRANNLKLATRELIFNFSNSSKKLVTGNSLSDNQFTTPKIKSTQKSSSSSSSSFTPPKLNLFNS